MPKHNKKSKGGAKAKDVKTGTVEGDSDFDDMLAEIRAADITTPATTTTATGNSRSSSSSSNSGSSSSTISLSFFLFYAKLCQRIVRFARTRYSRQIQFPKQTSGGYKASDAF
jgi:hypothetical protein